MRSFVAILTGLVALAALAPSIPANAATPLNCARASTVIGYTSVGRGVRVELLWAVSEKVRLEALFRRFGWERLAGEADSVQLYYAVPSRYLVMASKGGCHLAHAFLEETEAKALTVD